MIMFIYNQRWPTPNINTGSVELIMGQVKICFKYLNAHLILVGKENLELMQDK